MKEKRQEKKENWKEYKKKQVFLSLGFLKNKLNITYYQKVKKL